eukprot:CAMPEP_0197026520 /NCGR_PEP_ID=MMETSP1384-20130603/6589_1 /TAXON_ID=29189 /ORGANISM="Ammonia sp." /LENGTH=787 /DNA_ID=CAMNT_0042455203 /DNA_START=31 /DNA_END=2394 /DNA_ORIENTATION=+
MQLKLAINTGADMVTPSSATSSSSTQSKIATTTDEHKAAPSHDEPSSVPHITTSSNGNKHKDINTVRSAPVTMNKITISNINTMGNKRDSRTNSQASSEDDFNYNRYSNTTDSNSPILASTNAKPLKFNIQVHTESGASTHDAEKSKSHTVTDHTQPPPHTQAAPNASPKINVQSSMDGTDIVYHEEEEDEDEEEMAERPNSPGLNNMIMPFKVKPKMGLNLQINTGMNADASPLRLASHSEDETQSKPKGQKSGKGKGKMMKLPLKISMDDDGHDDEKLDPNTPNQTYGNNQDVDDVDEEDEETANGKIKVNAQMIDTPLSGSQSASMESSTLANEKSSLLERYPTGSLDVDNLIQRLIGNNSAYHKAYMRSGCNRNAREYSKETQNAPKRSLSNLSSFFSNSSPNRDDVHSANDELEPEARDNAQEDDDKENNNDAAQQQRKRRKKSGSKSNSKGNIFDKFRGSKINDKKKSDNDNEHNEESQSRSASASREESQSSSHGPPFDVSIALREDEMLELAHRCREIFENQPMLLELEAPLKIVGDIHGQYFDLLRIFEYIGFPSASCTTNYLFLGDYVDRGRLSIETIVLLFAYKLKYPLNFFLLRGNHEAQNVNRIYGFYDECKRRYTVKLWKVMCDAFNCLPVCALIEEKILCMHGGLSPQLKNIQMIKHIQRPTDIPESGLLCDLLWSDPDNSIRGWESNERGVSYMFGPDILYKFLKKHDLDLVARAHQVVEDGYEFFGNRKLVTIFSAPNYCGEFDNAGGIMSVDSTLMCSFQVLQPSNAAQ